MDSSENINYSIETSRGIISNIQITTLRCLSNCQRTEVNKISERLYLRF